jgi:alginate O-acetyltransferase complex protein AlgJ
MTSSSPARPITEGIIIAMFIVVIGLPLVGKMLPREGAFALTENRRPAPFPTIELGHPGWGYSIVSFPQRFERFWNDSFAFRWYLIRWNSMAQLKLGVSPSPKALVGKDGYLFYAGEKSVDYFRAVKPFDAAGLAQWRDDLESRRAWLAERGIRYLVVVAPSKETIYPEYMPPALRPVRAQTRLDQLLADLHAHSSVEVLDLRPALKKAKQAGRLYHQTDTHWNDAGAAVAYGEILARLRPWFPDLDAQPRTGSLKVQIANGGDLARILALEDRFHEEQIDLVPSSPRRAREVAGDPGQSGDVIVMECSECGGPRVVMNQDSFNAALAPFLAEHFSRFVLVDGTKLDRALIERERPALVIQEFVERTLMCPDLRGC